jgi:ribosome maturation factor RimP
MASTRVYSATEREPKHEPEVGARARLLRRKGWIGEMDAAALVRPIVEADGLELVEVTVLGQHGRRILRVTVDRDGGIDLDTLGQVSERISRRLDLEDYGSGRYELEVSSPGIERPLTSPAQFARFVGSQVKVRTTAPVDGASVHVGTLARADDDAIVVEVDGTPRAIALADLAAARTVADWDAELKRSTA